MRTAIWAVIIAMPIVVSPIDSPQTRFRVRCSEPRIPIHPREPFRPIEPPNWQPPSREFIPPSEGKFSPKEAHGEPLKHTRTDESKAIEEKFQDPDSVVSAHKFKTSRQYVRLHSVDPLETPIDQPVFVNFFPLSPRDFQLVYGVRNVSMKNIRELSSLSESFESLPGKKIQPKFEQAEHDFFQAIQDAKSSPIVFFGHSKNSGTLLVLPNGKTIETTLLHRKCAQAGARCLVLTCDGSDFSISGRLLAIHAHKMWSDAYLGSIIRRASNETVTVGDFRSMMIASRNKAIIRGRLTVTAVTGAASGLYLVSDGNRKRSK